MQEIPDILMRSPLFEGIDKNQAGHVLTCLGATQKSYAKNEYILHMGDPLSGVGIVTSGTVQVSKDDAEGRRIILDNIQAGQMFAESLVCAKIEYSPVYVQAAEPCRVMWIRLKNVISTCQNACRFHRALIANMLKIVARKNLFLNSRLDILSKKTIREKVMAYLYSQAEQKKRQDFFVPFDRNEMADFLCVDRSALCRELSKMQKEGLIKYRKNHFTIMPKGQ